jgi:hypothetical protein
MLLKIILQDGKLLLHKRILPTLQVLVRKHHHYIVNTTFTKTGKKKYNMVHVFFKQTRNFNTLILLMFHMQ